METRHGSIARFIILRDLVIIRFSRCVICDVQIGCATVERLSCQATSFTLTTMTTSHWGRGNEDAIFQTFCNSLSSREMISLWFNFYRKMFPRVQLTIHHPWWYRLDIEQATDYQLYQLWPRVVTHICIARPQWVTIYPMAYDHIIAMVWHELHGFSHHRQATSLINSLVKNIKML